MAISIRAWAWPGRRDRSGKTVVRAGFGIYHEDGQLDDQNLPAKNEVPSYSVKQCLQYLSAPTRISLGTGTISPNAEQRDRKDTYVEQWDLSVQRELPANFLSMVSYLGSHGVHLLRNQRREPDQSGYPDCAISFLCSSHRMARLDWREPVQRPLGVSAPAVFDRAPDSGKLHVVRTRSTTAPTAAGTATRYRRRMILPGL